LTGRTLLAPRRVLWDIDGTLVSSGGVGAEVFDLAIERTVGAHPTTRPRMSGKTDPQIACEYLAMLELAEDQVQAHLETALSHLVAALAAAEEEVRRRGSVLPGVPAAMTRTATDWSRSLAVEPPTFGTGGSRARRSGWSATRPTTWPVLGHPAHAACWWPPVALVSRSWPPSVPMRYWPTWPTPTGSSRGTGCSASQRAAVLADLADTDRVVGVLCS